MNIAKRAPRTHARTHVGKGLEWGHAREEEAEHVAALLLALPGAAHP